MKVILALLLGVAYAQDYLKELTRQDLHEYDTIALFNQWSQAFERDYQTIEIAATKYMVWLENLWEIADTNSRELSYKFRLNQFSDMTADEFKLYIHGSEGSCLKQRESRFVIGNNNDYETAMVDAPTSVDWTTKGVVTPVKNQGQCGSCWAFSTTGSLECDYAIQKGTLNSLSEQQLVDCSKQNSGCNGGLMDTAFNYVQSAGGLCSESEYAYTARDGSCRASSCGTKYNHNTGHTDVSHDSTSSLEAAIAQGCVSIGVEADQSAFQHYSSGVATGNCGAQLDHGVLAVGYGTLSGQDYWKVKNSWGASWGAQGYILLCRNCNKNGGAGECGLMSQPSYPTF